MVIIDCEGDGLIQNGLLPDEQQPVLAEIGAVKLDRKTRKIIARYHSMIKPPRDLTDEFTKITGITNDMVKDAPSFAGQLPALIDFFLGERELVAHNLTYDAGLLEIELRRIGMSRRFPWPSAHICTMEATQHIKGKVMKLNVLYEHFIGPVPETQTHRAVADTEWLTAIVQHMLKKGML